MKYIDELDLKGKTVFIRADLNVPLDQNQQITDNNRIRASLPTIQYALDQNAKIILASHLGRPKGQDLKLSLKPVAECLQKILDVEVILAPDCIGPKVEDLAMSLKQGSILLLGNLRFHKAEGANDENFSKALAKLAQVYVNDAFATAHRAHASTVGMVKYFKDCGGGFTLKSELTYFNQAFNNPQRPLVAIFGGAKVSTKIAAIQNVAKRADRILVGGAMANTFLAAEGYPMGRSLYEPELIQTACLAKDELKNLGCELVLPVDLVIAKNLTPGIESKIVAASAIPEDYMALDIGPASIKLFKSKLEDAKTLIWNGPMGAFETAGFSAGTYAIVAALEDSSGLTVVGGGDTDLALHHCQAMDKMSYVSTAGGAFLSLLEGSELPAVAALG